MIRKSGNRFSEKIMLWSLRSHGVLDAPPARGMTARVAWEPAPDRFQIHILKQQRM
jgi:hypothetical protein